MADNIFSRRTGAPTTNSPFVLAVAAKAENKLAEPRTLEETRAEHEEAQKTLKARRYLAAAVKREMKHKQQVEQEEHREVLLEALSAEERQRRLTAAGAPRNDARPAGPSLAQRFRANLARSLRGAASLVLGTNRTQRDAAERARNEEHRRHESKQKHKLLVGAQSKALSRYWIEHELKHRFQATMGWYLNEAHHDATGADPGMISMFLVAFLARTIYRTALEAIALVVLLTIVTALVWFVVRACWPVTARYLDHTESLLLAFVYDAFAFVAGLFVASYTLLVWPGLKSYAEACGEVDNDTPLWVDCTNGRTFVLMAYLFVFAFLGIFSSVYRVTILALLLTAPFMIILGFHSHETLDTFYTFTFASLSMAYFYATFARPVRGSYVWNLLLGISWYLFVVSILSGFGF